MPEQTINIEDDAEVLELSLSIESQLRLLWNSLGKPIAYCLAFIFAASYTGLGDLPSIAGAALSFIVGYCHCSVVPETELEKRRVL